MFLFRDKEMVKFSSFCFVVVCMYYQADNTSLPIYGVILYCYYYNNYYYYILYITRYNTLVIVIAKNAITYKDT